MVLAYNKDDEARGVEAFENFAKSWPPKVGKSAKLVLERWNLTDLTDKVRSKLVDSPAILPEQFFRSFLIHLLASGGLYARLRAMARSIDS